MTQVNIDLPTPGSRPGTGRFRLRAYYDGHDSSAPDPRAGDISVTLDAVVRPVLVWEGGEGWRMVGTGVLGGGLGPRRWWVNAMVDKEYHHPDPRAHVSDIASDLGLTGPGVGMLTAAEVSSWKHADDDGVHVATTVGLGVPVDAAAPDGDGGGPRVGTINTLVEVPVPMSDAALVNLVVTATEAKTQALHECGVPGTGTASDALAVAAPVGRPGAEEPYGGPRSRWGAVVARVVHSATVAGVEDWIRRHPEQAAAWRR